MKKLTILLAMLLLLSGCVRSQPQQSDAPAEEPQKAVTLRVPDISSDSRREHSLSSEDSELILELFYEHDKEVKSMPCDCISLMEFRFGDDYLNVTSSGMDRLEGCIDGELVEMQLDDNESDLLKQLVYKYAPDLAG